MEAVVFDRVNPMHARRPTMSAILMMVMISGCFPLKQYRESHEASASDCTDDDEPEDCPFILHEAADQPPYTLGIVEFDDQGAQYNVPQLEPFLATLAGDEPGYQGRIVLVFAHGWMHDARPEDSNLALFRELLAQFSAVEKNAVAAGHQRLPRRVVGVYLAWRGAAWRMPVLKYLTFWSRKDVAHRIGERQATETLVKIRQVAYRGNSPGPVPNRFVVMGHSFGAALVHSALSQLVANSLLTQTPETTDTLPLADAVLLFNPAFEAARMHHLFADAAVMERDAPALTVFTADNDRATGWAFPTARWINNVFGSFRDDLPSPLRAGAIAERSANALTVGHFSPYLTHDLTLADVEASAPSEHWDPERRRRQSADGDAQERAELYNDSKEAIDKARSQHAANQPMDFADMRLTPRGDLLRRQLSIFNVAMPNQIWDGHSIEQDEVRLKRFLSFLLLYIPFSASAAAHPEAPPDQIELSPPAASPPPPSASPPPPSAPPDAAAPEPAAVEAPTTAPSPRYKAF